MSLHEKKIGVLGGGQLGRMLIQAALDWNLSLSILDPASDAPCAHLGTPFICGSLTDYDTVYAFGKDCDILTVEIENVNTEALAALAQEGVSVYPKPHHLQLIKDKRFQKKYYEENGFPTAAFVLVNSRDDIRDFAEKNGYPFVNKIAGGGYDGRGVQVVRTEEDLEKTFDAPGLIEELVPIVKELAVIVARNPSGEIVAYPPVEVVYHDENLVDYLLSPAKVPMAVQEQAMNLAKDLVQSLDFVGLLAVELFLRTDGGLLLNEVAPRTHNSGHHTIEASLASQFQQHLRTICDLPLGSVQYREPAAMLNILGEEGYAGLAYYQGLEEVLAMPGVYVHLYGKTHTKSHRKMGHITVLDLPGISLMDRIQQIKSVFKVITKD